MFVCLLLYLCSPSAPPPTPSNKRPRQTLIPIGQTLIPIDQRMMHRCAASNPPCATLCYSDNDCTNPQCSKCEWPGVCVAYTRTSLLSPLLSLDL